MFDSFPLSGRMACVGERGRFALRPRHEGGVCGRARAWAVRVTSHRVFLTEGDPVVSCYDSQGIGACCMGEGPGRCGQQMLVRGEQVRTGRMGARREDLSGRGERSDHDLRVLDSYHILQGPYMYGPRRNGSPHHVVALTPSRPVTPAMLLQCPSVRWCQRGDVVVTQRSA